MTPQWLEGVGTAEGATAKEVSKRALSLQQGLDTTIEYYYTRCT